jgi:hypothetical protein
MAFLYQNNMTAFEKSRGSTGLARSHSKNNQFNTSQTQINRKISSAQGANFSHQKTLPVKNQR